MILSWMSLSQLSVAGSDSQHCEAGRGLPLARQRAACHASRANLQFVVPESDIALLRTLAHRGLRKVGWLFSRGRSLQPGASAEAYSECTNGLLGP